MIPKRTRAVLPGLLALGVLGVATCGGGLDPEVGGELAIGSWGGENAGMIVEDTVAHVHVGCTYGNFRLPVAVDDKGRIEAGGEYLLRAYPIAVGPTMPATLTGSLRGDELVFTVAVNDTIAKQRVTLGPATVRLGREAKLGPCPICASVPAMR